jgi:phage baseplate assembly protein gpV
MIRHARVVKVHAARQTLDCVDLENGYPIAGVPILSTSMSGDTGLWTAPSVPRPSSHAAASGVQDTGRVMVACLLPGAGGRYVCIGFVRQAGTTALTERDDEMVYRHPAGTVIRVEPDGTTIASLPGGVVLRLNIDGTAHLTAPTKVTIETPLVEMTNDLKVAGKVQIGQTLDVVQNITTEADTVSSGKSFLEHRHLEQGDNQNTSQPL